MQGEDGLPGVQGPPAPAGLEVCLFITIAVHYHSCFTLNTSNYVICVTSFAFSGASWREWTPRTPRSPRGSCKCVDVHNTEILWMMMKAYFAYSSWSLFTAQDLFDRNGLLRKNLNVRMWVWVCYLSKMKNYCCSAGSSRKARIWGERGHERREGEILVFQYVLLYLSIS